MTLPATTNFGTKTNFNPYGTFLSACASITERIGTDTELYLLFSLCLKMNSRGIATLSEQELAEPWGDDRLI